MYNAASSSGVDNFDARVVALRGGTFVYADLHQTLLFPAGNESTNKDLRSSQQPKHSRRGPVPQLSVDTAKAMSRCVERAAPSVRLSPRARTFDSPRKTGRETRDSRRPGSRRGDNGNSTAVASPYVRELRSRLEEGARAAAETSLLVSPQRSRGVAYSLSVNNSHTTNANIGRQNNHSSGFLSRPRSWKSDRKEEKPKAEAVGDAAPASQACPVDAWVRERTALAAENVVATDDFRSKAEKPLFTQLSSTRFPMPPGKPGLGTSVAAWAHRRNGAVRNGRGETSASSVLMTEVPLSAPSHSITTVAGVDETMAVGADRKPELEEEEPASRLENSLLEQMRQEPIRSYRVLRDATTRPASALITRKAGGRSSSLLTAGAVAQENLARSRHMFEHTRYEKQAELVSFLRWREDCRAAVTEHAFDTTAHTPPAAVPRVGRKRNGFRTHIEDVATPPSAPLLTVLEGTGELPTAHTRRHSAPAPPPQRGNEGSNRGGISSMWSRTAAVLAVENAREQLCHDLRAFEPSFPVAALSRESMERLKENIIASIHCKEPPARYRGQDLKRYLAKQYPPLSLGGDSHSHHRKTNGSTVPVSDFIDAMPSPAEAALVRHAFEILPH